MSDESKELDNYQLPESTMYSAVGTVVGLAAVTLMVILSFIFPEKASSMDMVQPVSDYIEAAGLYSSQIITFILLDSIFIVGYTSLFIGLWILIRDFSEIMSKIGLGLGLMVGLFDIIENTLIFVTVNGLQAGWQPDVKIYGYIFILNTFIDLLSYLAALIFAIIFLVIFRPWDRKFVLGLLLGIYVGIGLGSLLNPALLLLRSLFFVIGLTFGAIVLWLEEDIPMELLESLVAKQRESKGDFV